MKRLIALFLILYSWQCLAQTNDKFIIKEYWLDSISEKGKSYFNVDNNIIYEDSLYTVSRSCSGEWGGTIKFKNRKTGIEYSAASTCPVIVNKLNGRYYVTNSLAHLRCFSEVLEITNPEKMSVFKLPKPRKKKGKFILRYIGDTESQSTKGTKRLVDTVGLMTLVSFPYRGQLYHVMTTYERTLLTTIVNNRLVTVDTVCDQPLWNSYPTILYTKDKHLDIYFEDRQTKGYLEIFDNQIKIVRKK